MSDDTLARLAVCDAEAHAALHALGIEHPGDDAEIALACSEADAEIAHAEVTAHGYVVRALRRRADALRAVDEYRRAVAKAHAAIGGAR